MKKTSIRRLRTALYWHDLGWRKEANRLMELIVADEIESSSTPRKKRTAK